MEKNLEKSEVIEEMPMICADERAAVEFFEERLWQGKPVCAHCQSANVYQMKDAKTGERNKAFLWRCHDCKKQFTVRIGSVLEESRIPFRHWAYAFWRMATSKKGVSALEIQRHCQISYPSALFLLQRIRFAMTPDASKSPKLRGIVEADETYVGGKPRYDGRDHRVSWARSQKSAVAVVVQRNGNARTAVLPVVNSKNLRAFIFKNVRRDATVNTDQHASYPTSLKGVKRHDVVNHSIREYARHNPDGTVSHTNTAESSFAILKRGLHGIYHSVSKKHLHRYIGEFDFRWNGRKLNDGDRTVLAVQSAQGKRLNYKTLVR